MFTDLLLDSDELDDVMMTYIYVMPLPETYNGYGLVENGGLPHTEPHPNANQHEETPPTKKHCCSRLFSRCKCKRPLCKKWKKKNANDVQLIKKSKSLFSCFNCRNKKKQEDDKASTSTAPIEEQTNQKPSCWNRLNCCKSKRVGDTGCCPRSKRKDSWVDKRESITLDAEQSKPSCKNKCKNALRNIFCCGCCVCKRKTEVEVRRASMTSKKKSLTPTAVPPVDTRPKIDISLVEHNSLMRGAIPILPVPMAWICLICNIFLPGVGTVLSGMFCLCVGKPRFSQNDGPRPRIGAFIIDLIIGCGQLFTVLFCLVGWGWSIWWGVIMLKIAKKHKRIRLVEARALGQAPVVSDNHQSRDPERGS